MKNTFVKTMTKTNKDIVKKTTKFAKKNPNTAVAIGATGAVATAGLAASLATKVTRYFWYKRMMKKALNMTQSNVEEKTNTTAANTTAPATTAATAVDNAVNTPAPEADDKQQNQQ